MQRFFHGRIAEGEPLLHEVNAQQHLHRKWRPSFATFRCIWRNQVHQLLPWNDLLHLLQEFAFTCFFGGKVQAKIKLLHDRDAAVPGTHVQAHACGIYAEVP